MKEDNLSACGWYEFFIAEFFQGLFESTLQISVYESLFYDIDVWQILGFCLCCGPLQYIRSIRAPTFSPKNIKMPFFHPDFSVGKMPWTLPSPPPAFRSISLPLQHPPMLHLQWSCILGKVSSHLQSACRSLLLMLFWLWQMAAKSTTTPLRNLPWIAFCFWNIWIFWSGCFCFMSKAGYVCWARRFSLDF